MTLVVALGVAFMAWDLAFAGPYTRRFNDAHDAAASQALLVGQPEAEVVKLFGTPSRIDNDPRGVVRAYVYYPYPFVPISQVKVFCERGRVTGVKLFDD